MQKLKKGGFTLVELIVVITILAILGTIAFISLQGYSRDARDSKRTSDLGNIKTSLELYSLKTGKYPSPDSFSTITYSGGTENVWYQGVVGDIVTTNLKSLNEKPLDPLTSAPYTYSVTNSYKEYEVLALYEGAVAYSPIINQTNAAVTSLTPKIVGNYNGVFVITNNYIIPVPSIVTSETVTPGSGTPLTSSSIKSLVMTNGKNIPKNNLTPAQTGALNINLSVYTGSITKTSTDIQKVNAMKQIQNAYTGTTLSANNNIAYILNKTSNIDLVILSNSSILKDNTTKVLGVSIPVDGACGSSNGLNLTILPTTNLCNTGVSTTVVDNGGGNTYGWSCNGSNGGNNISCNANNTNPELLANISNKTTIINNVISQLGGGANYKLCANSEVLGTLQPSCGIGNLLFLYRAPGYDWGMNLYVSGYFNTWNTTNGFIFSSTWPNNFLQQNGTLHPLTYRQSNIKYLYGSYINAKYTGLFCLNGSWGKGYDLLGRSCPNGFNIPYPTGTVVSVYKQF